MGKYMRKAKITGEITVMELAQSSLGVRTRAKTLALQRLQKTTTPTNTTPTTPTTDSSSCSSYLQLRSRRLEKKPLSLLGNDSRGGGGGAKEEGKQSFKPNPNPNSNARANSKSNSRFRVVDSLNSASGTVVSVSLNEEEGVEKNEKKAVEAEAAAAAGAGGDEIVPENLFDLGIEASFGENVLEIEGRGRSTRETTPCSLIRGSDTIGTPGSTTRPTNSSATNRRLQNAMRRNIPTAHEMEEFFAGAEQQQQRLFAEKYNFDPVTESPLPGRFEWERVDA